MIFLERNIQFVKEVNKLPWAKFSYDRITNHYTELLNRIYDKKHRNMDLIVQETLVRAELLKRNITKRQKNIISLIVTFSFGYGKEWALIPKMKDFELAGISKIIIRKELKQIIEMNMIEWKEEENLFRIRDPREWNAPYNSGYNDDRSRELFFLNLKHAGIDASSVPDSVKKGE